jgi:hypothetical protein
VSGDFVGHTSHTPHNAKEIHSNRLTTLRCVACCQSVMYSAHIYGVLIFSNYYLVYFSHLSYMSSTSSYQMNSTEAHHPHQKSADEIDDEDEHVEQDDDNDNDDDDEQLQDRAKLYPSVTVDAVTNNEISNQEASTSLNALETAYNLIQTQPYNFESYQTLINALRTQLEACNNASMFDDKSNQAASIMNTSDVDQDQLQYSQNMESNTSLLQRQLTLTRIRMTQLFPLTPGKLNKVHFMKAIFQFAFYHMA